MHCFLCKQTQGMPEWIFIQLKQCEIPSGEARLIQTGLQIELPKGTEAQIRPRSGLALKHSVTVLNSPGTIDEGYRGEIGVILINHGKEKFVVEKSMRIAQMVIQTVPVDSAYRSK